MEYCYNGIPIIRGYCSYKTLIKYSQPHPAYQRKLNSEHTKEICEYISGTAGYKFMPEIVLSYDYSGLFNDTFKRYQEKQNYVEPLQYLYNDHFYGTIELKDIKTKVTFRKIKLNTEKARMIRLELPYMGGLIKSPLPFNRLDGNHRLDALKQLKTTDFQIPFCIVLLSNIGEAGEHARAQAEMEIFHNINSKARPLTLIEQYIGLFNLFTVDELKRFGKAFSVTQAFLIKHKNTLFNNLKVCLIEKEDLLLNCAQYLIDRSKKEISEDDIVKILNYLEHTYFNDFSELKNIKNRFALIPYVYYCYIGGIKRNSKLDAYNIWFIKNKLYDVKDLDPASLIDVFDRIYEIRKKQIFVAMPFKDELNFVFTAICNVVNKINQDNGLELPMPIRIDKQIVGFSYDIVNEILDNIQNAGLLIADLTENNANVYYEAGYAQGLLKAKLGNTSEILYLISNPNDPDNPIDAAKFDVNHYKLITYKNDGNSVDALMQDLEKEIKAFYGI